MDTEDFNLFLSDLTKVLAKHSTCCGCESQKNLKRIRTCNHVVCSSCLDKCPECNKTCNDDDLVDLNVEPFIDFIGDVRAIISPDLSPTNITDDHTVTFEGNKYEIVFLNQNYKPRRNKNGEVQLHLACKTKSVNKVKELISENNNLNEKDFAGWAPLHEGILAQSVECCTLLLENGALVDTPGPEYITPLHKAIETGNNELIKLLVSFGASLDVIDLDGKKPSDYTTNKTTFESVDRINVVQKIFIPTKLVVYCHSIEEHFKEMLKNYTNITVLDKFTPNTTKYTHIIIKKTHKLSSKILIAIVSGLLFLTQEDIVNLHHPIDHKKLQTGNYIDNQSINKAICRSIMNTLLNRPKLFDGCSFFLMHKKETKIYSITVNENFLKYLVESGGGQIRHRMPTIGEHDTQYKYPFHTDKTSNFAVCSEFVIFNEDDAPLLQYKTRNLKHVSSRWFINCILEFCISDHDDYVYNQ